MSSTIYYATPADEALLVRELLRLDVWAMAWGAFPDVDLCTVDSSFIDKFVSDPSSRPKLLHMYVGWKRLADTPVLKRGVKDRLEVDFIPSQCIIVRFCEMNETSMSYGDIARMPRNRYEELGFDPEPVIELYQLARKLFRRHAAKGVTLILNTSLGTVKRQPGEIVMPGAVEWYKRGGLLQCQIGAPVKYDLSIEQ